MTTIKTYLTTMVSVVLLCLSQASHSEISAKDLPDLGNLAKLIGEVDESTIEDTVYDQEGKISAGMFADDSSRGEAAMNIADILGDGDAERQQRVASGLEQIRTGVEDQLKNANFAMNDLGVGLAMSFVTFWELASEKTLPPESSLKIAKVLVHTFKPMSQDERFDDIPDAAKAEFYDWSMMTPIAMLALVQGFEAEGQAGAAQQLREKSATLFVDLFKLPHTFVTLSDDGELSVNVEEIETYQEEQGLSDDW